LLLDATRRKTYEVSALSPRTGAETATVVEPAASGVGAVCDPYTVVVPYWKK